MNIADESDLKAIRLLLALFLGQGYLIRSQTYSKDDVVHESFALADKFMAEYKKDADSGS
jgi:hypothetical protein